MPRSNLKVYDNSGNTKYLDVDVNLENEVTVTTNGLTNISIDSNPTLGTGCTLTEGTFTMPITIIGFATSASATTPNYNVNDNIVIPVGTTTLYAVQQTITKGTYLFNNTIDVSSSFKFNLYSPSIKGYYLISNTEFSSLTPLINSSSGSTAINCVSNSNSVFFVFEGGSNINRYNYQWYTMADGGSTQYAIQGDDYPTKLRTLVVTEDIEVDDTFYTWFTSNTTKQEEPSQATHKLTFDSNIIITVNGSSVTTSPYNLNNGDVITATTSGGYKIDINGTLYGDEDTITINSQDINIVRSTAETFDTLLVTINYTETTTPDYTFKHYHLYEETIGDGQYYFKHWSIIPEEKFKVTSTREDGAVETISSVTKMTIPTGISILSSYLDYLYYINNDNSKTITQFSNSDFDSIFANVNTTTSGETINASNYGVFVKLHLAFNITSQNETITSEVLKDLSINDINLKLFIIINGAAYNKAITITDDDYDASEGKIIVNLPSDISLSSKIQVVIGVNKSDYSSYYDEDYAFLNSTTPDEHYGNYRGSTNAYNCLCSYVVSIDGVADTNTTRTITFKSNKFVGKSKKDLTICYVDYINNMVETYAGWVDIVDFDSNSGTITIKTYTAFNGDGDPVLFIFGEKNDDAKLVNINITNGTLDSYYNSMMSYDTALIAFSANDGYSIPSSISLTNVNQVSYNDGYLYIDQPTGEVDVTIECTYTLPKVATVTGLGNSDPTTVTFDVPSDFKFTDGEYTDSSGNVFVKIPKMYRKVNAVSNGQITSFSISNAKVDDNYKIYPVFLAEDGVTELDWVGIGKYMNKSSTKVNSVASGTVAIMTLGNARSNIKSNYSYGKYQLYDWMFHKLWQDLIICKMQTINTNSGSGITTDQLGIYWGTSGQWIDGFGHVDSYVYLCDKPSKYVDSPTASTDGYFTTNYRISTTNNQEIQKLGYDEMHPFVTLPAAVTSNSSYNTYYCDQYYYVSGNHPLICYAGSTSASAGAFYLNCNRDWTTADGERLCYRPLGN